MSTYVMSDIHGQYQMYLDMLKKIDFSSADRLFIIGDVIDRGPEPLKLLMDVLERENVTLLMGNHEYMMFQTYCRDDIIIRNKDEIDEETEKIIGFNNWYNNGGDITDAQFMALSEIEREAILEALKELPVIIPDLKVGDKTFYLVHSSVPFTVSTYGTKTMKDLTQYEMHSAVWERTYPFPYIERSNVYKENKDRIVIAGHTPVTSLKSRYFKPIIPFEQKAHILKLRGNHYINIDCGCAAILNRELHSRFRLGCLRLDDMKEFYI